MTARNSTTAAPEEATYRVSNSKAPAGLRIISDGPEPSVAVGDERFTLAHALKEGWVDTAPAHRRRKPPEKEATPDATAQAHPLIYAAMAKIVGELPAVGKGKKNKDQGFAFRGIDDLVNALGDVMARHGVFYLPRTLERITEDRLTGGQNPRPMHTVHLHVEFTFYAADGSYVVADCWGEGVDLADKATAKAHTFAQKSCLLEAFCIATADLEDPDSSSPGNGADPFPDTWFTERGWQDRAAHDTWRAKNVKLLKEDAVLREAFGLWRTKQDPVVTGFAEGPHSVEDSHRIDAFMDGKSPCAHPETTWRVEDDGTFICGACDSPIPEAVVEAAEKAAAVKAQEAS